MLNQGGQVKCSVTDRFERLVSLEHEEIPRLAKKKKNTQNGYYKWINTIS